MMLNNVYCNVKAKYNLNTQILLYIKCMLRAYTFVFYIEFIGNGLHW